MDHLITFFIQCILTVKVWWFCSYVGHSRIGSMSARHCLVLFCISAFLTLGLCIYVYKHIIAGFYSLWDFGTMSESYFYFVVVVFHIFIFTWYYLILHLSFTLGLCQNNIFTQISKDSPNIKRYLKLSKNIKKFGRSHVGRWGIIFSLKYLKLSE